ncbi:MAG: acetate--CoA ligase family protein [Acidobacteriota bacterium]
MDQSKGMKSLDSILRPRSVAVIGASRKKQTIGREIIHNLIEYEFNGKVFPVNPNTPVIHSMKSYPSICDVPDDVDLAIIVVPKEKVLRVVDECGQKGVKGLIVITAGFKEAGKGGAILEEKLKHKVKEFGMRMVGPNCMGVINTEADIRLDASFAASTPPYGKVGFISQSGALGEAILANAKYLNLGVSMFVSMGNKTDVSGNDLLEYWEDDENVHLILMYLESFGNPRKFTNIARRITKKKPIIAVKSGRTAQGAQAASSHTGSMVGGLDIATESLLEQCGVIRVSSMREMFTLATAFSNQPIPGGNRVAIVTNAGGPAILATDACVSLGLKLTSFEPKTTERLKKVLPSEASVANPVDMIASSDARVYSHTLDIVKKDKNVDGLIVIFVSPVMIDAYEVAKSIIAAAKGWNKPMLSCFMGKQRSEEGIEELKKNRIPVYSFPEEAALALAAMNRYRILKERQIGNTATFEVDRKTVASIIARASRQKRNFLHEWEVEGILKAYGLPVAPSRIVASAAEAIDFSIGIGYPVVLKAISPLFSHKTDVGGVKLDLRNADDVGMAYREIMKTLGTKDKNLKIKVQRMIKGGKEVIIGVTHDAQFGPVLMFGLGGIYVEIMKDMSTRIHPITDVDADEMISSIRSYPLLKGVRGEKGVNVALIKESLLRISQLVTDFQEIKEMDINPFIVSESREDCMIVDARLTLH